MCILMANSIYFLAGDAPFDINRPLTSVRFPRTMNSKLCIVSRAPKAFEHLPNTVVVQPGTLIPGALYSDILLDVMTPEVLHMLGNEGRFQQWLASELVSRLAYDQ
jgi:hypothetical protein